MKKLLIVIFVLTPIAADCQVNRTVDEFTGVVTYQTDHFDVTTERGDVIQSKGIFMHVEDSGYIFAHFVSSNSWQHLMEDQMLFLIDGERLPFQVGFTDTDVSESTTNFSVTETNGIIIDKDFLRKVSNGTDVRFRIGANIYRLNRRARDLALLIIR